MVMPAKAGIQVIPGGFSKPRLDSRLRGNDGIRRGSSRRHPFKMFEHLVQIRSPAGF
jgi:hypothetical protein